MGAFGHFRVRTGEQGGRTHKLAASQERAYKRWAELRRRKKEPDQGRAREDRASVAALIPEAALRKLGIYSVSQG